MGRPVVGESGDDSPDPLWDVERVYVEESFPQRRNVDDFTGNKPCSQRLLLLPLTRTVAVVTTSAVLGIDQLLLELAARGD